MKNLAWFLLLALTFCAALVSPTEANEDRPNVLLICVDDLRPELNCYGASYIHSPNIDRLAANGRMFRRHYVQAPTCGASRYALLTGKYGGENNQALFQRAKQIAKDPNSVSPSMPAWFRKNGYATVSVGKVSHHPGGRGGSTWNDDSKPEMPDAWDRHLLHAGPWKTPVGWMHGLANGEVRNGKKGPNGTISMNVLQALDGPDSIYPDGPSINGAMEQLDLLAGDNAKPFFLAVGILRPHLPFGAPKKYLDLYQDVDLPPIPHPEKPNGLSTWHKSGEFYKYNRDGKDPNVDADYATRVRKHYAACVSYADAQVGKIMRRLDDLGLTENTVVVLWGDHGWHLGEHAIWGKHALFEESLRSPLIVAHPGIKDVGKETNSIVETVDIFPTLCELTDLPMPEFASGVSLKPILDNPEADGHDAYSYYRSAQTIRTDTHRFIIHKKGGTELYSHESTAAETVNLSDSNPDLVLELTHKIKNRLSGKAK